MKAKHLMTALLAAAIAAPVIYAAEEEPGKTPPPPPPASVAAPGSVAGGTLAGLRPEYLYGVAGGLLLGALCGSIWKRRRNSARGE